MLVKSFMINSLNTEQLTTVEFMFGQSLDVKNYYTKSFFRKEITT